MAGPKRKIAALLAADVVGYTRLMEVDDQRALQALNIRREIFGRLVSEHGGRMFGSVGDSLMAEFPSAVEAVLCAVEIQRSVRAANEPLPADQRMLLRIGLNLGELIEEHQMLYGDGVNVAARLQALAPPGGICVSGSTYEQVKLRGLARFRWGGRHRVKNVAEPVATYQVVAPGVGDESSLFASKLRIPRLDVLARFQGRRLAATAGGVLLAAAAFLLLQHDVLGRSTPRFASGPVDPKSIAVLPFDNRSASGEDAAFVADGIHDDLITLLSKLGGMRVIARTSVERYRDRDRSIREIAAALGVSTILEGGVRLAGESVRVNVKLIDAQTTTHVWAETYDRELTASNVFSIQRDVAEKIADSLHVTLSSRERRRLTTVPTQSTTAYEAYLLAKHKMKRRTTESVQAAVSDFQRAIELDPSFALAYSGLAQAYEVLQDWGHLPSESVLPLIREAAARALELDDQLSEAHMSLAGLYELHRDLPAAEAAYLRAIELDPGNATARNWYRNFLLTATGRWEEAVQQGERAVALGPLSPLIRVTFGETLSALGRFDEALEEYQRAIELDPDFAFSYKYLAEHHLTVSGRLDEALHWYRKAVSGAESLSDIGGLYLMLGDAATGESWIEQARLRAPENLFVQRQLALLDAYRGRDELAAEFARRYLDGPSGVYMDYMLFVLRNADLRAGRHADARLRYERMHPGLARDDPEVHRSNYRSAIDLALVLQEMGERARAQQLLEQSSALLPTMVRLGPYGYGAADAEIHALSGRRREALEALRAAAEEGWRLHWYLWTVRNPNLRSIADEPGYRAVISELESDMASQLERVRGGGEVPPGRTARGSPPSPGRGDQAP